MNTIDFAKIQGSDTRERFQKAVDALREIPGSTLRIPAGTYVITSERARETMRQAISGGYGENPEGTMFRPDYAFTEGISFEGVNGAVIEAEGVTLMAEGFMEPVALKNCANITLKGLTIDYLRKPFSMGIIRSCEKLADREARVTVHFDSRFPVDGHTVMPRVCAYDFDRQHFHIGFRIAGRKFLGDQTFEMRLIRVPDVDLTGMEMYVWHSFHYRPAILVENAENITLTDVTIHAQPGMGIVGHRSKNIRLMRLKVVPSEGLHMSTNTDATHFTSCEGELVFDGCSFDGHGDDATNVHTFYHDFEVLDAARVTVRTKVNTLTHSLTLDYANPGDILELNDKNSQNTLDRFTVVDSKPDFDGGTCVLTLDKPIPERGEEMYLSDVTQMPRLSFVNSRCNNHWARSVLIKTRHAVVRNCEFRASALQAIHIAAEGDWHEGVSPADIEVSDNTFTLCGAPTGAKTGGIKVEISAEAPSGTPIDGIRIAGNTFDLPNAETAVYVKNVKNAVITGNNVKCAGNNPFFVSECENVSVIGNRIL